MAAIAARFSVSGADYVMRSLNTRPWSSSTPSIYKDKTRVSTILLKHFQYSEIIFLYLKKKFTSGGKHQVLLLKLFHRLICSSPLVLLLKLFHRRICSSPFPFPNSRAFNPLIDFIIQNRENKFCCTFLIQGGGTTRFLGLNL